MSTGPHTPNATVWASRVCASFKWILHKAGNAHHYYTQSLNHMGRDIFLLQMSANPLQILETPDGVMYYIYLQLLIMGQLTN